MFDIKAKLYVFQRNPVIIEKRDSCSDDEIMQAYHEHCVRELLREFCTSVLQTMSHGELEFQKVTSLDMASQVIPYAKQVDLT